MEAIKMNQNVPRHASYAHYARGDVLLISYLYNRYRELLKINVMNNRVSVFLLRRYPGIRLALLILLLTFEPVCDVRNNTF